jgi:hypothetical protein
MRQLLAVRYRREGGRDGPVDDGIEVQLDARWLLRRPGQHPGP